jgi:integrase
MVTGMGRAELLALRWAEVDLAAGMLTISRSYVRAAGRTLVRELDTALRPDTVDSLSPRLSLKLCQRRTPRAAQTRVRSA